MAEPATSAAASATAAACTGAAAALCLAEDVALQLLGVPLTVVLGALTGALGARYFLPAVAFWPAAAGATIWTVAASILAEFARWALASAIDKPVPAGALAGIALVTAALGPFIVPVLVERAPAALRRILDSIKGGQPNG